MTAEERETELTSEERAELGRYLIDLILGLEDTTQKWIEFLIAVQAGLIIALGFLLRPWEVGGKLLAVPHAALMLVPFAGAAASIVLSLLAVLAQTWQGRYVVRFNALPYKHKVFSLRKSKASQPLDAYGITIMAFAVLVLAGWVLVYFFLVRPAAN